MIPPNTEVAMTSVGPYHLNCASESPIPERHIPKLETAPAICQPPHVIHFEDTEEEYRRHLAALISRTKSRAHGRYFNQFVRKCQAQAAAAYPKGAATANKKDGLAWGSLAALAALFSFFG
jgi:hypothetical protein